MLSCETMFLAPEYKIITFHWCSRLIRQLNSLLHDSLANGPFKKKAFSRSSYRTVEGLRLRQPKMTTEMTPLSPLGMDTEERRRGGMLVSKPTEGHFSTVSPSFSPAQMCPICSTTSNQLCELCGRYNLFTVVFISNHSKQPSRWLSYIPRALIKDNVLLLRSCWCSYVGEVRGSVSTAEETSS